MSTPARGRGKHLAAVVASAASVNASKASVVDVTLERELRKAFVEGVRWAARTLDERELNWCAADDPEWEIP